MPGFDPKYKKIAIIGAGMGGLVAGNLLARRGHRVTMFESHGSPGGYTAGFWRKGYYFESGTLSFESSDVVFKVMKELDVFDRVKFVRQVTQLKSKEMDGVCKSYDDLKSLFRASYPSERTKLDKYFGAVDKMCRAMTAVMSPAGFGDYLLYPVHVVNGIRLYKKYEKVTITDFTARYFAPGSSLYGFFKSLGYPDMSAAIVGPAYLSFFDDYWTVAGGMQSWADALADNFRRLGGDLQLNVPVTKILTKHGRAVGVVAKDVAHDADYVISAADYKKTMLCLLDDQSLLPESLRKKTNEAAVSEGVFTVYLGLKLPNDQLRKYLKVPHASYYDEQPGVNIRDVDDEKYFEKTSVLLYSPSLLNPELAPEGRSSLMIQTASPYRWMGNWGGGDKAKYRQLKASVEKTLIAKAAAAVPGLADNIEFEDAATPLTYERYTGNTDGATSAWSWNPKNRFYRNIMSISIRTPVTNLLIGSSWSCQIGGIPSAINAARACARVIG